MEPECVDAEFLSVPLLTTALHMEYILLLSGFPKSELPPSIARAPTRKPELLMVSKNTGFRVSERFRSDEPFSIAGRSA